MLPLKDENPTTRFTWITLALIVLNLLVFIGPQGMNDPQRVEGDIALQWAAIPCEVVTGDGLTTSEIRLTFSGQSDEACDIDLAGDPAYPDKPARLAVIFSMFMHADWMHLLGNVWFLWLFGNNVEDRLGPMRYLLFYLTGGVVASVATSRFNPTALFRWWVPLVRWRPPWAPTRCGSRTPRFERLSLSSCGGSERNGGSVSGSSANSSSAPIARSRGSPMSAGSPLGRCSPSLFAPHPAPANGP